MVVEINASWLTTTRKKSMQSLQEKRLNTTKKVAAITTNVVVIGVIAKTKRSIQTVVINSEAIGLCNARFSLQ